MVAISLHRGNLHKVPDIPRRWTTPKPSISIKDFKTLLRRRSRALSVATTSASIPNLNPSPNPVDTIPIVNGDNNDNDAKFPPPEDLKDKKDLVKELLEKADALLEVKNEENVKNPAEPEVEAASNTVAAISDKEKRKNEVKEKLEILNEKKHSLVQVLKQIMNAEEQLKRQNSTQGNFGRPPLPLQVENATDSGSMTKVNNPRIGSGGNLCSETNGVEADNNGSNHNLQSHQLPRMTSTSPSSDSQQRKPASNMVPHSYRTTLGVVVAGSPSRFASAGGQGQGPSSVSASGTNYVASSPSPAASGGTSVLRDVKLPSPWN